MLARLRRWFKSAIAACAVAYPVTLLGVVAALYFVGEHWWVTAFALYLPRVLFAVPLPLLVLALWLLRFRRLLWLQVASLLLLLFPLMGLRLSWPRHVSDQTPTVRILQYNVDSCNGGSENIASEILAHQPQIVFIQELQSWRRAPLQTQLSEHYPHVYATSEFMVASAFPIVSVEEAPDVEYEQKRLPAREVKYVIATSLGNVAFFSLHPISPRSDFRHTRGAGLSKEIASGRLFKHALEDDMQRTNRLRKLQLETTAARAAAEKNPAVIIGDINVPELSATRHRALGGFRDGFADVGFGFGYSFPSRFPWLRLDVILATAQLDFVTFEVGHGRASDHRAVVAELMRASP